MENVVGILDGAQITLNAVPGGQAAARDTRRHREL